MSFHIRRVIYGTDEGEIISDSGGEDVIIYGLGGPDYLYGLVGEDHLYGGDGNDYLYGGGGNDYLYGGDGDDHLYGGNSGDFLHGDEGNDTLDGGDANFDVVSYGFSQEGVTVNLTTGKGSGGDAEGDTLLNIEWVIGSRHNDVLTGVEVEVTEVLPWGCILYGGDGDDELYGTSGRESFYPGAGSDLIDGGGGRGDGDTVYYASSPVGVVINLATGRGSGGDAEGDRFKDVEAASGSRLSDHITGDEFENSLFGGLGDDTIEGGAGKDTLDGGYGEDTLLYNVTNGSVTVDLAVDRAVDAPLGYAHASGGDAGTGDDRDRFREFEKYAFYGTRNEGYVKGTGSGETIRASSDTVRVTVDGGAGDDTLRAFGDALFILKGGAGADEIYGGAGNDKIVDYQGSNRLLDGGEGVDTLSYFLSDAGVEVDLRVNLATITRISDAGARTVETSRLRSIENVVGSNHDDVIIVPDSDVVYGLDGRGGTDRIQFDLAQGDFVVGLWGERGASVTRNGKSDGTLNFEEYVFTGEGNIRVEGTSEDNRFHVTESAEATVRFIGGGGADTFTGGEGTDYFVYASLTDSTTAAADVIHGFTAGTDKLDLSRIAGVSWDDVAVRSVGEDLSVTVDGGLEIMLKGIASLSESDFIFADTA